jgi:hypothetical protein
VEAVSVYYEDELVTLWHGDCRDITEWLDADVLLTDPPYGVSWKQGDYLAPGRSEGWRGTPHAGIQNDSDLTARDAVLSLWGEERPALVFGAINRDFPAGTRRVLVWKKPNDSGFLHQSTWRLDWEPIFVLGKWPQAPASDSSVIATSAGSHRQYAQGIHPHAKPVDTLGRLIGKFPPGVIADPFAGSGSTLVAAKMLGRRAVGVEIEERYCEVAAKRLAQDTLFGDVA